MRVDNRFAIKIVAAMLACISTLVAACGDVTHVPTRHSDSSPDPAKPSAFVRASPLIRSDASLDLGPEDFRIKVIRKDFGNDGTTERIVTLTYDDGGRIISEVHRNPAGRVQKSVVFEYEGARLVKMMEGKKTTSYLYKDGRVRRIVDPKGNTSDFMYDNQGRIERLNYTIDAYTDSLLFHEGSTEHGNEARVPHQRNYTYVDGLLSTVTSPDRYNHAFSQTFEHGDRDLVESIETEIGPSISESSTYITSPSGRPLSMSATSEDGERVVLLSYKNNRVVKIRSDRRKSGTSNSTMTTELKHSRQGLILSATTVSIHEESGAVLLNNFETYEYEAGRCARQFSASPARDLYSELQSFQLPPSTALDCAYRLDYPR